MTRVSVGVVKNSKSVAENDLDEPIPDKFSFEETELSFESIKDPDAADGWNIP